MKKLTKILLIIPTILIIGFIVLGVIFHISYSRNIATNNDIEKKDYYLVEKEFNIKLPESAKVGSITFFKGKDNCLNVRISLNDTDVTKFNKSIGFETKLGERDSEVEKTLWAKDGRYMKFRYFKSVDSKKIIDLIKYNDIGNDTYKIASKNGFHS